MPRPLPLRTTLTPAAALLAAVTLSVPAHSHATHSVDAQLSTSAHIVYDAQGFPVHTAPTQGIDFSATVKLDGCSGSLVRFHTTQPTDQAVVMTNGHCLSTSFKAGEVWANKPYNKRYSPRLLKKDASVVTRLNVERIMYATMTGSDLAFLRVKETYNELMRMDTYAGAGHPVAVSEPTVGSPLRIITGFWREQTDCTYEARIHQLKEDRWTWNTSIRYSPQCRTKGGWSGSPIFNRTTTEVVGIHNTGNDDGDPKCGMNNPCEFDERGRKNIMKGRRYGQQIWWVNTCLAPGNTIDLRQSGCQLPK